MNPDGLLAGLVHYIFPRIEKFRANIELLRVDVYQLDIPSVSSRQGENEVRYWNDSAFKHILAQRSSHISTRWSKIEIKFKELTTSFWTSSSDVSFGILE